MISRVTAHRGARRSSERCGASRTVQRQKRRNRSMAMTIWRAKPVRRHF